MQRRAVVATPETPNANYVQMAHSPNIILAKFSRYTVYCLQCIRSGTYTV